MLNGLVDSLGDDAAIVDVGGVGYHVHCSARTLSRLPAAGERVRLLIETHVREDHIHLFGFLEPAERDWFGLLRTVQGIGARLALAILSGLAPADLANAVSTRDIATLTRISGVGKRTAERLIIELKDKAGLLAPAAEIGENGARAGADDAQLADALSALLNLGYRRIEAHAAVIAAARNVGADAPLPVLITAGLKELSR